MYDIACARGEPPTRAVADHFKVSRTAAAKWVARCRGKGLLPPTRQGVVMAESVRIYSHKIKAVAARLGVDPGQLQEAVLSIGGDLRVQRADVL